MKLNYHFFHILAFLSDEELAVVHKLRELSEQHRAQLIVKDKEVLEKSNELEKVLIVVQHLLNCYNALDK